jgi:hypothetical protein
VEEFNPSFLASYSGGKKMKEKGKGHKKFCTCPFCVANPTWRKIRKFFKRKK